MIRDYLAGAAVGLWNLLVAVDQFANVAFGSFRLLTGARYTWYGHPDETISSVLGRKAQAQRCNFVEAWLVWGLDHIDRNHVFEAIEHDAPQGAVFRAPRWSRE